MNNIDNTNITTTIDKSITEIDNQVLTQIKKFLQFKIINEKLKMSIVNQAWAKIYNQVKDDL